MDVKVFRQSDCAEQNSPGEGRCAKFKRIERLGASDMSGEAARVAVERSGSCRDTKHRPSLIPTRARRCIYTSRSDGRFSGVRLRRGYDVTGGPAVAMRDFRAKFWLR